MATNPQPTEHPYYVHVRNCESCSGPYGHCTEGLRLKNEPQPTQDAPPPEQSIAQPWVIETQPWKGQPEGRLCLVGYCDPRYPRGYVIAAEEMPDRFEQTRADWNFIINNSTRADLATTTAEPVASEAERAAVWNEAIEIAKDYEKECSETTVKFSESDDKTSERIYWRADGACDALEHLWQRFEAARDKKDK